jgi:hypothetical protein
MCEKGMLMRVVCGYLRVLKGRFRCVTEYIRILCDLGSHNETLGPAGTSLDLLQAIYRSPDQPLHTRMRAAIAALPYEHPKLAVTAVVDGTEDLGARLHRAIERSAKVIELRVAQEAAPTGNGHAAVHDSAAEVSTAAMRRPMALIRRR